MKDISKTFITTRIEYKDEIIKVAKEYSKENNFIIGLSEISKN